jgi:hypothetical protein
LTTFVASFANASLEKQRYPMILDGMIRDGQHVVVDLGVRL